MYLWILQVSGLGKICGQSYLPITVLEKSQNFENFMKIDENEGLLIRNNAFVAWASLPGAVAITRDYTWLVETRYFFLGEQYYSTASGN